MSKGGRKRRAVLKVGRGASCFRGQPISVRIGGCARSWAAAILWEGTEEGQSEAVRKEAVEVVVAAVVGGSLSGLSAGFCFLLFLVDFAAGWEGGCTCCWAMVILKGARDLQPLRRLLSSGPWRGSICEGQAEGREFF